MDERDEQALLGAVFDIRRDVTIILRLLSEDEEEGSEEAGS
ncbi:MAG: hypothetical protein WD981_06520 [Gaiellaceae bacterium]